MEDRFVEENVKHRLILAGIRELEEYGITDFSLRRVAVSAQVSCAAPYRHFKSKEDFVGEIIAYVGSKWDLLSRDISSLFKSDLRALVIEICIANLRFRVANRNFPIALAHTRAGESVEESIVSAVKSYSEERGLSISEAEQKSFVALALISGAVSMITDDNSDKVISMTRTALEKEFT